MSRGKDGAGRPAAGYRDRDRVELQTDPDRRRVADGGDLRSPKEEVSWRRNLPGAPRFSWKFHPRFIDLSRGAPNFLP